MAYIDVSSWSAEHVVSWMRGLHSSLDRTKLEPILREKINGSKLKLVTAQDLVDLIASIKVEALQAILAGISQLRYMSYSSNQETLQSLTLNLACQARYLHNQLIQAELSPRLLPVSTSTATPMTGNSKNRFDFAKVDSNMQINQSMKQRVSLETLDSVSQIVDQILHVVNWLNATSSIAEISKFNKDFRSIVLRVAVELTSTAQRDQFVEQPNDVIKKTSKFLADYCEWVVLAIDDPDFIQPCWLDVVSVKKKADEDDYGIKLQAGALQAALTICEVVFSSPAHRSGRISLGDEIVQVDYLTVIGWPEERIRDLMRKYTSEVILTIKKKPSQLSLNPSVIVMKPYAIPLRRLVSQNSESTTLDSQGESIDKSLLLESQQSLLLLAGAGGAGAGGGGCCSDSQHDISATVVDEMLLLEPPKEPKGPVYELQSGKPRRELRRRVSISGSISDALVDLALADSLPIPSLEKCGAPPSVAGAAAPAAAASMHADPANAAQPDTKSKLIRISKETLTKSVSHDTAKLYLHTLSIDRKHLWQPQNSNAD